MSQDLEPRPGYHLRKIERGVIGELSKIQEELDELKDAEEQGVRVMQLVEASDMVGALVRWLEKHHPGTTLDDLVAMHKVTRRAFENGVRAPRSALIPTPSVPSITEILGRICGKGCYYEQGHSGRCSDDPAHP